MKKTKVIVLAENALTTPGRLVRYINSLNQPVLVKETCFGAYIEGEEDLVDTLAQKIRNFERNRIFCKDRGYAIWDKRRCRAFRGGGPREGFHQLEAEQRVLDKVGLALDNIDKNGIMPIDQLRAKEEELIKRESKIPVEEFKKIIDKVLGSKNEA
ncbi:MAG: methanogenesis marker 6 protein [Methanococci archaeon]|uniref:Methanogenesis marker protein 6 n=1 Tax=Methanocaldococcus vulcanius (strain ATCC 700851 / DSM 12094 / M7) TaxID=579137 RepID=C9RFP2_METVM|nr:methanogenesis marker 6 protein [Methanocaldococcus vulcanius]ACX72394.1 methanogenesis marker protein 6 [Methanocaldococcus vulcanius M7]NPA62001.1 methanogenesis marker 6 protein [Methanococci archaeon]